MPRDEQFIRPAPPDAVVASEAVIRETLAYYYQQVTEAVSGVIEQKYVELSTSLTLGGGETSRSGPVIFRIAVRQLSDERADHGSELVSLQFRLPDAQARYPLSRYVIREIQARVASQLMNANDQISPITLWCVYNSEGTRIGIWYESATSLSSSASDADSIRFHPRGVSDGPDKNYPYCAREAIMSMTDLFTTGLTDDEGEVKQRLRRIAHGLIFLVHHCQSGPDYHLMRDSLKTLRSMSVADFATFVNQCQDSRQLLLLINDLAVIIFNLSDLKKVSVANSTLIEQVRSLFQNIIRLTIQRYREQRLSANETDKLLPLLDWRITTEILQVCPVHTYPQLPGSLLINSVGEEAYPEYNPDEFIDPSSEVERLVTDAVAAMLQGSQPQHRWFVVSGPAGVGKTWTLRHLQAELLQRQSVECVYVDCNPRSNSSTDLGRGTFNLFDEDAPKMEGDSTEQWVDSLVLRFMKSLARRWMRLALPMAITASDAPLWEQSYWLGRTAEKFGERGGVLVIIVEGTEIVPELADALKKHFLRNIALASNVLVIQVARRLYRTLWHDPLRHRLGERKHIEMIAWPMTTTEQSLGIDQLYQTGESGLDLHEIHKITAGYPFSVKFLLEHGINHLNDLINALIGHSVPPNGQELARFCLEAALVLNDCDTNKFGGKGFRSYHVRELMISYDMYKNGCSKEEAERKYPEDVVNRIVNELERLGLIKWINESYETVFGYVLDPAIKAVLHHHLAQDPELLRHQHLAAAALYDRRNAQHPGYGFDLLANQHRQKAQALSE